MIKYNYSGYYTEDVVRNDWMEKLLRDNGYECELSDKPDYIFHNPYTNDDYLKCDGIRIFSTGEDIYPDFNLVDYAIGFDYISLGDRYFRHPLYLSYKSDWELAREKHKKVNRSNDHNRKFCNFIYSNSYADSRREEFFNLLSKYKKIDSGGRFLNNIGYPVEDKLEFQKNYKFSIAFENASTPGYTTEKLTQAFAAGTVPIYWGNPVVDRDFNTKSFINCHDYASFDEVISVVKRIDADDELYYSYLQEPICTPQQFEQAVEMEEGMKEFILHIFEQPYEKAFRRNLGCWGMLYNKRMKVQLMELDMRRMTLPNLLKVNVRFVKRRLEGFLRKCHLWRDR